MLARRLGLGVALGVAALAASCDGGEAAAPSAGPPVGTYAELPPAVYVPKVKTLLLGLAATDEEVREVARDPRRLGAMIDAWMARPEYQAKMLRFFELAFQQTQIAITDFSDQVFPRLADINPKTTPLLLVNAEESFARTALELDAEGRPFTDTMTTRRFMMTPALMELYAFLDTWHVDDDGVVTDRLAERFAASHPGVKITVEASEGPIPIQETLDPASPRFMRWYDPDVALGKTAGTGCGGDPIQYPPSGIALHFLLHGALDFRPAPSGGTCGQYAGSAAAPQLQASDFTDWRMVTIRPPAPGEPVTRFYDLPKLRAANELVLSVPRVGFFSTPAFFANWPTNASNQMRVTTNQALIVATGKMIDPSDPTPITSTPGLDPAHVQKAKESGDATCFDCHRFLDPTRSILAATYSWDYHEQIDPAWIGQKGMFQFQGVVQPVGTVDDFGATLASHPRLGPAWLQKLCYYANSAGCDENDPAFKAVLQKFHDSGSRWSVLVREFFASPLAIFGQVVAVSRRDHLCAALDARLGLTDVCGLSPLVPQPRGALIPQIAAGLPSDGYGRGAETPVLPTQPTLFYRAGTENICEAIAAKVIDAPEGSRPAGAPSWSSAAPQAAIDDFVRIVMGLPSSDPRTARSRQVLRAHYDAALKVDGITPAAALQSTFVAACLAPSAVTIGL